MNHHVIECRCDECNRKKAGWLSLSVSDREQETFTAPMPKQWGENVITFDVNWTPNDRRS